MRRPNTIMHSSPEYREFMRTFLLNLARRVYPPLITLPDVDRFPAAGYVMRALISIPPSLIGLVWLAAITDRTVLIENGLLVAGLFIFMLILSQLWLEMYYETEHGGYRSD